MSREGPLDLVIRRAQVTSAMMTSRREGRVEAWVTWGWRGKARSRSEDQKKKKKKKRRQKERTVSFLFGGFCSQGQGQQAMQRERLGWRQT